ncbi:hypothetical protein EIP91_005534 [Steccherinum ochraceum]|uniref:Pentacotripeptide-repeat region of PRORP domain-containing protein n=1 Tax=Steccherinum ochraceum TaxID=92696 RepID=A0A4R0RTX5_9APHY|nr:hypothetical protein EIP91_005534 [Steccherinum ochraceum]
MLRHASHQAIAKVAHVPQSVRLVANGAGSLLSYNRQAYVPRAYSTSRQRSKLDEIHKVLSAIPPLPAAFQDAPRVDIDALNKLLPVLQDALKNQNFRLLQKTWDAIVQGGLLRLIGRVAHEKHSRYLVAFFEAGEDVQKNDIWAWNAHEWTLRKSFVADMAIVTAAAGYPAGLTALLNWHIKRNEPKVILQRYAQYAKALRDKDSLLASEDSDSDSPFTLEIQPTEESAEESDDEMDMDLGATEFQQNPIMVSPQILLFAITAHAMQDDFIQAVHTILETNTRLSKSQIKIFIQHLPAPLAGKVTEYANRLNVARLMARSNSLGTYLTALTEDRNIRVLRSLYTSVVEELSEPSPWLTMDPAKVNDQVPVLLPEFTWALFLRGFLFCYDLPLAAKLWEDLSRFGLTPTLEMWTALLEGYAYHRMGPELLSAWEAMRSQGVVPDAAAYHALLEGLHRAQNPREAIRHFHRFRESLAPAMLHDVVSVHLHGTMINGLLQNDALNDAKDVLKLMVEKGPKPDIAPYNMFLQYYGDKGMMKELASVLQDIDKAKLRGDVITFAILLSSLLKVRQDAPNLVFDVMRKQGVKPNVVMYSGIIDHLLKQRNATSFAAAMDILRTIEQDTSGDLAPTIVTYTIVLTGILRATWLPQATQEEWRQDITRRMAERKIKPTPTTLHVLLEAALEIKQPHGVEWAMMYYRSMPKPSVRRDTWYVLLAGLANRKEWDVADEVVRDMVARGFVPQHSLARLVHMVKRRQSRVGSTITYDL